MKKQFLFFSFTLLASFVSAQGNYTLMRHDTTILARDECHWLVKSSGSENKSVSLAILEAVQSGKLQAFDPLTNELIPGNKIFTWGQSSDTTMVWDEKKDENVLMVIQNKVNPAHLSRFRIFHDWYLDPVTGKVESQVKMFDVIGEVRNPSSGDVIGYTTLCRIVY